MYSSSASSSPTAMYENTNLANSFIITTNGLVSRSNSETSSKIEVDKRSHANKSVKNANEQTNQKKPLRRLNNANCEIQNDATLLKHIPSLYERFIEVVDSKTKESCQMMMCKACRFLLKKNADILIGHLCKQKDIDKFSSIPIANNQLIFRSKPKNRATGFIWDEFEEVIEPSSNMLLGYARCKRCREIIKTSDPKSIPAVLRRHVPQCPCGPFPLSLLNTSHKSSSSENNHTNQKNSNSSINTVVKAINSTSTPVLLNNNHNNNNGNNNSLNSINTSAHNLSSIIKELSSNNLLNAMKNLTNQNNLNLNNLNGLNNFNLNSLTSNTNSPAALMPLVNNLSNFANKSTTNSPTSNNTSTSALKFNQLKNEFRDRCVELCYKELISLETLRSPAFKRLCQTLLQLGNQNTNVRQLPDATQIFNQLYAKYSTHKFQVKNDLQIELYKNIGGALVCDSQDDLCILATYYINNDWRLKEIVLSADAYGNEINYFITNTLNDYHLNEEDKLSKFTFVSRGGHFDGVNISLTSIAHTIDYIINNTIFYDDTYTAIIESCRLVCNELGIEVKLESIVENVDWIAKYEIMRHVLINIDKCDLEIYPLNFELIEFLVSLLTPFRNACELRNCSNHPTLNHVLLWYYKIMKHLEDDDQIEDCEEFDDDLDDSTFIKRTKKSVRDAVEKNFELHNLHKIACFLWPNFRSLKMLKSEERLKVHEEVRKLIDERFLEEGDEKVDYQLESCSKKARTDFSDWEETSPLLNQDELQRYVNETLPTCDENNVLSWWRDHHTKFPKLAQLAKWVLSIPASVTLIEKFKLSKSPKLNDEILFLHCNLYDK